MRRLEFRIRCVGGTTWFVDHHDIRRTHFLDKDPGHDIITRVGVVNYPGNIPAMPFVAHVGEHHVSFATLEAATAFIERTYHDESIRIHQS